MGNSRGRLHQDPRGPNDFLRPERARSRLIVRPSVRPEAQLRRSTASSPRARPPRPRQSRFLDHVDGDQYLLTVGPEIVSDIDALPVRLGESHRTVPAPRTSSTSSSRSSGPKLVPSSTVAHVPRQPRLLLLPSVLSLLLSPLSSRHSRSSLQKTSSIEKKKNLVATLKRKLVLVVEDLVFLTPDCLMPSWYGVVSRGTDVEGPNNSGSGGGVFARLVLELPHFRVWSCIGSVF